VPLVPSTLSVRTLEQLRAFLDDDPGRAPEVLAFFSMVDRRKRLHREIVHSLPGDTNGVVEAVVPTASVVELMGPRRAPVVVSHPRTSAAKAYGALWSEVRAVLDGRGP
jgi:chromosome partitioning protein